MMGGYDIKENDRRSKFPRKISRRECNMSWIDRFWIAAHLLMAAA